MSSVDMPRMNDSLLPFAVDKEMVVKPVFGFHSAE